MSSPDAFVRAVPTLDCARKLRIHYLLPRPLTHAWVERLADLDVTLRDFSHFVAGGKQHVEIRSGEDLFASGVIGRCRMVATYRRGAQVDSGPVVDAFETAVRSEFGRIVREGDRTTHLSRSDELIRDGT